MTRVFLFNLFFNEKFFLEHPLKKKKNKNVWICTTYKRAVPHEYYIQIFYYLFFFFYEGSSHERAVALTLSVIIFERYTCAAATDVDDTRSRRFRISNIHTIITRHTANRRRYYYNNMCVCVYFLYLFFCYYFRF